MTDEEMAMLIIGRLTFRLEKLAREHKILLDLRRPEKEPPA